MLFVHENEVHKRSIALTEYGGRREIRTLDRAFDPIHTFQACAFNRSAIRPFIIIPFRYF